MSNKHLIYATGNYGKIKEIGRHFGFHGIPVSPLSDFVSVKLNPDETGATLGENAFIKATAYAEELVRNQSLRGKSFTVISDDTGVFIDGLGGEPGIRVRRWIGREMTDEEIIAFTLLRTQGLTGDQRNAKFRTVLCMIGVDEDGIMTEHQTTEGFLDGYILETAHPTRVVGFPFESLFYSTKYDMILGDLHRLPDEKKRAGMFNHREQAIELAVPIIKARLGT